MLETLQKIFDLSAYDNRVRRQDALFVYMATTVVLVLVTLYVVFVPDEQGNTITLLQDALNGSPTTIIQLIIFYGVAIATYIFNRVGKVSIAGIGVPVMWYGVAIMPILLGSRNLIQPDTTLSLGILIIISGLVNRARGLAVGTLVALVTLVANYDPQYFDDLFVVVAQLAGIGVFVFVFIRYAQESRIEGAQKEVEARQKILEITTQISNLTLNRIGLSTVLTRGLELIQQGYPQFYHAQVFLLDDSGRKAQLISSTGEIGRALVQKQHSIGVGTQSVIGQATLRGTHIITRTTDRDSMHQHNEFLPETVLEGAFPLRVGDKIIGALDMQSKTNFEISDIDLFTYQSLADSFALAIDNVRQFEMAEKRVRDNQDLAQQAQKALQEVDRLNKRLIEEAWSDYLDAQDTQIALSMDFDSNTVQQDTEWTPSLTQALQSDDVIQSNRNDHRIIAVPLKVRGQTIGAMEFELDEDGNLDPDDLELIQEVSERFGLAAENTRLVEESQRVAQREALINEIGSRLQATNNVESTLTEAVRSINHVLKANRVSIKLREPGRAPSNTSE